MRYSKDIINRIQKSTLQKDDTIYRTKGGFQEGKKLVLMGKLLCFHKAEKKGRKKGEKKGKIYK